MPFEEFIPLVRSAPPVLRCGSFRPGHDVHHIQATRVAPRKAGFALHDVRLVDATSVQVTLDVEGANDPEDLETRLRFNHQAERLAHVWEERRIGLVVPGAALILVGTPLTHTAFSVSHRPIEPCSVVTGDAGERAAVDGAADVAADVEVSR